jgi:hypothetical protein
MLLLYATPILYALANLVHCRSALRASLSPGPLTRRCSTRSTHSVVRSSIGSLLRGSGHLADPVTFGKDDPGTSSDGARQPLFTPYSQRSGPGRLHQDPVDGTGRVRVRVNDPSRSGEGSSNSARLRRPCAGERKIGRGRDSRGDGQSVDQEVRRPKRDRRNASSCLLDLGTPAGQGQRGLRRSPAGPGRMSRRRRLPPWWRARHRRRARAGCTRCKGPAG